MEVCINTGANTEAPWYIPKIDLGSTIAAEFVAKELNARLNDLMSTVRRESYFRGWNDAKSKRRKADCFPGMCYHTWFEDGK